MTASALNSGAFFPTNVLIILILKMFNVLFLDNKFETILFTPTRKMCLI